jgi:thiol-disulfide isomerase/thioredoxin
MSNIINVLYNIIKPYKRSILIITLAIIFIIASNYVYSWYYKPIVKDRGEDIANYNANGRIITIYLFKVDWCPQCVSSLPDWESFSRKYNGTIVNGYIIECKIINCTDPDENKKPLRPEIQEMMNKYDIEHYPTVKMLKDNIKIELDGKVSEKNLDTFVNTMSLQK